MLRFWTKTAVVEMVDNMFPYQQNIYFFKYQTSTKLENFKHTCMWCLDAPVSETDHTI